MKRLRVEDETYGRLEKIAAGTGLAIEALAGHILRGGIEGIERAGGIHIGIDGKLTLEAPKGDKPTPAQLMTRDDLHPLVDPVSGVAYREVRL